MADLEDLGFTSIIDMDTNEAIDLLRQIRLQRRMPEKKVTSKTKQTKTKLVAAIDPIMAAELLKLLQGGSEE